MSECKIQSGKYQIILQYYDEMDLPTTSNLLTGL